MSTWTLFVKIWTVINCEFNANVFFWCLYNILFTLKTIGGWGTLCIKEHFTSRNTLLLKSWTHFAAQHTLQSHNLLLSTLCIVTFCSKEQFASNWLVTVCSLTHFTPQHTLPTGIIFSLEHSASKPSLLPRTLFSSAQFASQHTLLLSSLYSIAHFASWNTLIPGIFWSKWLHLKC